MVCRTYLLQLYNPLCCSNIQCTFLGSSWDAVNVAFYLDQCSSIQWIAINFDVLQIVQFCARKNLITASGILRFYASGHSSNCITHTHSLTLISLKSSTPQLLSAFDKSARVKRLPPKLATDWFICQKEKGTVVPNAHFLRRAMKRGGFEAKRELGPISRKGLRRVLRTWGRGTRSQDRVWAVLHLLTHPPHPHNNTLPIYPFPCNPLVCPTLTFWGQFCETLTAGIYLWQL